MVRDQQVLWRNSSALISKQYHTPHLHVKQVKKQISEKSFSLTKWPQITFKQIFFCKITARCSSWRAFKNTLSATSTPSFERPAYVQPLTSKDLQLHLHLVEFNRICLVQHITGFYFIVFTEKPSFKKKKIIEILRFPGILIPLKAKQESFL